MSSDHAELIVCELLCFIQNKLDTLPTDTIVQLCVNHYKSSEIVAAKRTLSEACKSVKRLKQRKGGKKDELNVSDIIIEMSAMPLDAATRPRFVASDLGNLPPITFNAIDVSVLLKKLESLSDKVEMLHAGVESQSTTTQNLVDICHSSTVRITDLERSSELPRIGQPQSRMTRSKKMSSTDTSSVSSTFPPVESSVLSVPLSVALPPVESSVPSAPLSVALPPIESYVSSAPLSVALPPVESSVSRVPLSVALPVPPVESSVSSSPLSVALPVPPVESSVSSAFLSVALPPVKSSVSSAPVSVALPVPPVESSVSSAPSVWRYNPPSRLFRVCPSLWR